MVGREAQEFAMESVRRPEGTGVTIDALHPGFLGTGFGKTTLACS